MENLTTAHKKFNSADKLRLIQVLLDFPKTEESEITLLNEEYKYLGWFENAISAYASCRLLYMVSEVVEITFSGYSSGNARYTIVIKPYCEFNRESYYADTF